MTELRLDITKNPEQNASMQFERAKKLRKKIDGANEAIEKARKKLARVKPPSVSPKPVRRVRKGHWYEKFRWFISSEGFLVVGGRDATTNEIVIKKHADEGDLVLHTDMAGSPFFVIKAEGRTPGEQTRRQAADATATFSRAWQRGLPYSDVFCVSPGQVSKEAQSGEFLPKGAFMIRGKTEYLENEVNLALGIYQDAVMAGPVEAVSSHCDRYAVVIQGDRKISDVAKQVQKSIAAPDLDEVIRALPAGGCDIKRS
jgi:predicted ribosome quality control (RQC) complex YloA/Tae2 family protein